MWYKLRTPPEGQEAIIRDINGKYHVARFELPIDKWFAEYRGTLAWQDRVNEWVLLDNNQGKSLKQSECAAWLPLSDLPKEDEDGERLETRVAETGGLHQDP